MNRHYYISDNLDDLESIELELQDRGFETPQIHLYSRQDKITEVDAHKLHEVTDFTKRDVFYSGLMGLGIGLIGAIIVLACFYLFDWHSSAVGWMPAIFLAIIVLGFCTWEGGLRGIQEPNRELKKFDKILARGRHIFYIDFESEQQDVLRDVISNHPTLEFAGEGAAAPSWLVQGQVHFKRFIKTMP